MLCAQTLHASHWGQICKGLLRLSPIGRPGLTFMAGVRCTAKSYGADRKRVAGPELSRVPTGRPRTGRGSLAERASTGGEAEANGRAGHCDVDWEMRAGILVQVGRSAFARGKEERRSFHVQVATLMARP